MATKRIVHVIAVLCLSVLTVVLAARVSDAHGPPEGFNVTVTNPASNPVQTQNVGGGAATQVGQRASKIVNLSCQELVNSGTCGSLSGSAFTVPSGQALIVTDLQWGLSSANGQGNYDGIDINVGVGGSFTRVSSSSAPVDAKGSCQGELHLATGIVVPPGGSVQVTSGLSGANVSVGAFLQGYLVPNP